MGFIGHDSNAPPDRGMCGGFAIIPPTGAPPVAKV